MSQGSNKSDRKQSAESPDADPVDLAAAGLAATAEDASSESSQTADDAVFQPLTDEAGGAVPRGLDMIMDIPVTLSVELGSTRLSIRELLDLAKGSIVELDGLAGEPMELLINGYLVAHGEVVVVEDKYGVRITDIVNREDRIRKLNR